MAIADYVKTVWVNNTTPAIQASALNNIENKLDEVVDAGIIIESGSNANGSYQRFSDGTMEAWGSFGITMLNGLQQYNGLPYQVAFADLPIVMYIVFNPALSWDFILRGAYDNSNVPSFTLQYFNATTQIASIKYHAKGRWRI